MSELLLQGICSVPYLNKDYCCLRILNTVSLWMVHFSPKHTDYNTIFVHFQNPNKKNSLEIKKISNEQKRIQSDTLPCPQNQKGKN